MLHTSYTAALDAKATFEARYGHGAYRYEIRAFGEASVRRWQVYVFSARTDAFLTLV